MNRFCYELICFVKSSVLIDLRRMMVHDRRLEPRVGERVPYVVVYGMPGLPLIQLVRRPMDVLQDPSLRLNATYYITKQILPPLARMFQLIGVDVFSWYQELPRVRDPLGFLCYGYNFEAAQIIILLSNYMKTS